MNEHPEFHDMPSPAELARDAGRLDPADSDIEQLGQHCDTFITAMPGNPNAHGVMMARTKLSELLHWLRFHRSATARGSEL